MFWLNFPEICSLELVGTEYYMAPNWRQTSSWEMAISCTMSNESAWNPFQTTHWTYFVTLLTVFKCVTLLKSVEQNVVIWPFIEHWALLALPLIYLSVKSSLLWEKRPTLVQCWGSTQTSSALLPVENHVFESLNHIIERFDKFNMAINFDLGPGFELSYVMSLTSQISGMGWIATIQI